MTTKILKSLVVLRFLGLLAAFGGTDTESKSGDAGHGHSHE